MIVECEKCKSKFRLNEGLLSEGGSTVRCSVCKNVFVAYPPGMEPSEEPEELILEDLEDTASMEDVPPVLDEQDSHAVERMMDDDFELAFGEAMEGDAVAVARMALLLQNMDVRQIPVLLVIVQAITHQEPLLHFKTAVINGHRLLSPLPFVDQSADSG